MHPLVLERSRAILTRLEIQGPVREIGAEPRPGALPALRELAQA